MKAIPFYQVLGPRYLLAHWAFGPGIEGNDFPVVLLASETFFLCGGHNVPIADQSYSGIVIESRDPKNVHVSAYKMSGAFKTSCCSILFFLIEPSVATHQTSSCQYAHGDELTNSSS